MTTHDLTMPAVNRAAAELVPQNWLLALAAWFSSLREARRKRVMEAVMVRRLQEMDDHLLADIGLTRGEIRSIVRDTLAQGDVCRRQWISK